MSKFPSSLRVSPEDALKEKVSPPVLIDYCPKDLGICSALRVTLAVGHDFDSQLPHLHSDGDGMQKCLCTVL